MVNVPWHRHSCLCSANREDGTYARGGGREGGVARWRGDGDATDTRSVEKMVNAVKEVANTAGSRETSRNDDAGAPSDRSIEQLFSQPPCLRSGHVPDDLQQHDARVDGAMIASDGNVRARMMNARRACARARIVAPRTRPGICFAQSLQSQKPPGRETGPGRPS
jgi:hypothetical protein